MEGTHGPGHSKAPFPFMRLPYDIQYQILLRTGLVHNEAIYPWADGFVLGNRNGRSCVRKYGKEPYWEPRTEYWRHCCIETYRSKPNCSCPRFPIALFKVSHQFSMIALRIFFSRHRIILTGSPNEMLQVLQLQVPEMVRHIRTMDLRFCT
jgi:hypothetical protein